jgi:hypothetical protein
MPEEKTEVTEKVNASNPTTEETEPAKETGNSEETETKVTEPESEDSTKKLGSDYLGTEVEGEDSTDWKKRYSDSTKGVQKLQAEKQELETALNTLEKLGQANPRIAAEIQAAQNSIQANPNSTLIQQQVAQGLEPIKKIATKLHQKDQNEKIETLANFEKKNPNMFPKGATVKEKTAIRQQIGKVAAALQESGMGFQKSIERAYLSVNPDAAIQKGRDEALLQTHGNGQAEFSSQTSTEGKQAKPTQYTKRQLEIASKFKTSSGKNMKEVMLNK